MKTATFLAGAAAVLCALPACNTHRGSVEQKPTNKVAEPAGDPDKDNAPAVMTPELAQRLESAIRRHPAPFVTMRAANSAPSLRVPVGKPVTFELAIPGLSSWANATVASLVVRRAGGFQDAVPVNAGNPAYTFPSAGPAMLMLCAGPKGAPVPDPELVVTHCTKTILSAVGGAASDEAGDDFLGETGMALDVEPLVSPVRLRVGSELPVRFHYMSEEAGGIVVAALRPDGSVDRQITSRSGVAHFQVTQPGRWTIRFAKAEASGERVGELVFEIPGGGR
jgi:hypothetical protein